MDKPIPQPDVACALVVTTVGDAEIAQRIARTLVDARLAACVQSCRAAIDLSLAGRRRRRRRVQVIAKTRWRAPMRWRRA